ncbi:hypothetical protein RRG08_052076 [Elysia crispata]|uniref:Uncharacterized protein n=1 Tax=Elysia crispata TaxID=231223 RepID=A0AAE1A4A1_9GAST|nr:hypothetical protein RRG08_052076 [Elysia crispata]
MSVSGAHGERRVDTGAGEHDWNSCFCVEIFLRTGESNHLGDIPHQDPLFALPLPSTGAGWSSDGQAVLSSTVWRV